MNKIRKITINISMVEDQDGIIVGVSEKALTNRDKENIVCELIDGAFSFGHKWNLDVPTLIERERKIIELEKKIIIKTEERIKKAQLEEQEAKTKVAHK